MTSMIEIPEIPPTDQTEQLYLRVFVDSTWHLDDIPYVEGTPIDINAIAQQIVETHDEYSDWDWRELREQLYINVNR
jgi:hypothetical protein